LEVFFAVGWRSGVLKVWLYGLVLLVELGEVGNDVLDDVGMWERVDLRFLLSVGWNAAYEDY
jgi:hypothetical protein